MTIRRTESAFRVAISYERFQSPASLLSFRVGLAVEAAAEDGDLLRLSRGGTGDLGVTLFRRDRFLLGLGAIAKQGLAAELDIQEDPRAFGPEMRGLRTGEEWLEYARQLRTSRPTDLYLRFNFGTGDLDVREGEYVLKQPWHLFVARIFTPGTPGRLSQLAVVHQHRAIDEQMVIESTRQIATSQIEITH